MRKRKCRAIGIGTKLVEKHLNRPLLKGIDYDVEQIPDKYCS